MHPVSTRPRTFVVAGSPGLAVVLAEAGLACCTLEVESAVAGGLLVPVDDAAGDDEAGDHAAGDHTAAVVLMVSGTVTRALAPAVVALHDELAARAGAVRVMAVGACASTGGPYWDAPTVTAGIDRVLPVASYVPGCPPSPQGLVAALRELGSRS